MIRIERSVGVRIVIAPFKKNLVVDFVSVDVIIIVVTRKVKRVGGLVQNI